MEDEDSSDGGFKQRVSSVQPITRTVKRIECIENNVSDRQQTYSRQTSLCYQKSRFDKTCSSFDDSYDHTLESPLKRPTKLYFIDNMVYILLSFAQNLKSFGFVFFHSKSHNYWFKNKNFAILGVSLDKEKADWIKAIKDDGLTWTHISDLKYWNSAAVPLYNIEGIPFNVLVDPEGKIIGSSLRGADLENKLAAVLK